MSLLLGTTRKRNVSFGDAIFRLKAVLFFFFFWQLAIAIIVQLFGISEQHV